MTPAILSYSQLAKRIGCNRHQARRLCHSMKLTVTRIGNRDYVPLIEIEQKLPLVWESIFLAEQLDARDDCA